MAFSQSEINVLLVQTGRRCCICKAHHLVQIHHIVPLNEGGTDDIDNAIPLCPTCHVHVHTGDQPGRVVKKYTASELKLHRQLTIEITTGRTANATTSRDVLKMVSDPQMPLSRCFVEGIEFAKASGDADFEKFCRDELTGYSGLSDRSVITDHPGEKDNVNHRLVDTYMSVGPIDPQALNFYGGKAMIEHMKATPEQFVCVPMVYPEPVAEIEVRAPKADANALISINLKPSAINANLPDDSGLMVVVYMAGDTREKLLRSIRTAAMNRLLVLA